MKTKFDEIKSMLDKKATQIVVKNNPQAKFMLELDITQKQLQVLQAIVKSHPYFPDLALDDYTFDNNMYSPSNKPFFKFYDDLLERGIITKEKKSLYLSKSIAKKYWEDIVYSIPVELVPNIDRKFLEESPLQNLKKAYTTLTSLSSDNISRDKLIDGILKELNINKGEKMTDNKKDTLTPSIVAKENGISASAFRKMLRKLYGKAEGNWNLTQDKVNKVLKAMEEHKKEVAEGRSERMAKLQEARKKAQATKSTAKPAAKKVAAKK